MSPESTAARRREPQLARSTTNRPVGEVLLDIQDLSCVYGVLRAVDSVTLTVDAGRRHALIGPNGAGKSTLFGMIGGTVDVSEGTVHYRGQDITNTPIHLRSRMGIAKTFQHSSLFGGLTAAENVAMAVRQQRGMGMKMFTSAARVAGVAPKVEECLHMAGLDGRGGMRAKNLSHGERRQLEVAVALACDPSLLLLDEPTAGMSAAESGDFVRMIKNLPTSVTVMIVEHDLDVVFGLADRICVLAAGEVIADGTPEEIQNSEEVQIAYLGATSTFELFHHDDEGPL